MQVLSLSGVPVGGKLGFVSELKRLRELDVSFTSTTDHDVEQLVDLVQLETLNLSSNPITCESLDNLLRLQSLKVLYLDGIKFSADELQILLRSRSLKTVYVRCNPAVTSSEVRRLSESNIQFVAGFDFREGSLL